MPFLYNLILGKLACPNIKVEINNQEDDDEHKESGNHRKRGTLRLTEDDAIEAKLPII
ncbi:hypothetical protein PCASD_26437 [Puccinia coronata f. sp. avenae]|uniref:Uncharacterized protein n=1 Tax=Puccinia coronata f. sp. avenae TaxID=200324 RepID=A0A2N5TLE0_9BASI|nr:hypothetical protein PCASD_26437 [Puccinia coronata f. sp. avenae]